MIAITADEARKLLDYNPTSGALTWRVRAARNVHAGQPAGSNKKTGHMQVRVRGGIYLVHRLAWLMTTGDWPKEHIDHINGNPADNRWVNLRDVSASVNLQNRRGPTTRNSSGFLGVSAVGSRWFSQIERFGRVRYLGTYSSPEEAHAAYLEARDQPEPEANRAGKEQQ